VLNFKKSKKMKKIIIFLSLIIVALTTNIRNVYAEGEGFGIYSKRNAALKEDLSGSKNGLYKADSPGGRPGSGGAIGQENSNDNPAPVGDGCWIILLAAGCYVAVIVYRKRNTFK
jgi:hypothetical protein